MSTKVKEIIDRPTHNRSTCPICSPKKDRVREDQIWGRCPTNKKHRPHASAGTR